MKIAVSILISIFLLLASSNSNASLIGDEIFLSCMQSGAPHPACEGNGDIPAIVGAGVEYPDYFNFQNSLSIDVAAESIWVTFDNGPYCGWFTCDGQGFVDFLLTDLDWVGMPTGFITGINVITNMQGIQTGFGDHSVHFSLPETQVTNDMFIHIDILTDHRDISEPGVMLLMGLALLTLGFRRRQVK